VGVDLDRHVQRAVAVDDVLVLATLDHVATTTTEEDVALGPDTGNGVAVGVQCGVRNAGQGAGAGSVARVHVGEGRRERLDEVPETRDPVDAGLVESITPAEPEPT